MRRVVPLALVAAVASVLASCTSGTPRPTASGSPTPSATAAPSSSSTRAVVLVVERLKHPGLWLYRVDHDLRATLVRTISSPDGVATPSWSSVSGGPTPTLCTVWGRDDRDDDPIWCYPWGEPGGALPMEGEGYDVAVRPDGREVAYQSNVKPRQEEGSRFDLVVAPLGAGDGTQQTFVSQSEDLPAGSRPLCRDTAGSLTWVADSTLLIQEWGANDFPGELYSLSTLPGPVGKEPACRELPEPTHHSADGYNYFTEARSYDAHSFLAVEGQYCEIECDDHEPPAPQRFVRVDLSTGRVVAVPVLAAKGRFVDSVTGGPEGLVYVTYRGSRSDRRVYVRWSPEERGLPISGLPADLDSVVAQP